MSQASRQYADMLKSAGLDAELVALVLADERLPVADRLAPDAIDRWLRGEVVPGMSVRFALLKFINATPKQIKWEAESFTARVVADDAWLVERLCEGARVGDVAAVRAALADGVSIDGWDGAEWNAISYAAERGDVEVARVLLSYGASPLAGRGGLTLAWADALRHGGAEIVKLFLDYGAKPDACVFPDTAQTLLAGSRHDDPAAMAAWVEAASRSPAGLHDAMHAAASVGNAATTRWLLDAGAPANGARRGEMTSLMAAAAGGHGDAVDALLRHGAHLASTGPDGETALHHAARAGAVSVVRQLLDAGADRAARNDHGQTPADVAAPGDDGAGRDALRNVLARHPHGGPSWFRPDGEPLTFRYSKAFGLGFDPRRIDDPILFGGDHGGYYQASTSYMLSENAQRELERFDCLWITPFLEKVGSPGTELEFAL